MSCPPTHYSIFGADVYCVLLKVAMLLACVSVMTIQCKVYRFAYATQNPPTTASSSATADPSNIYMSQSLIAIEITLLSTGTSTDECVGTHSPSSAWCTRTPIHPGEPPTGRRSSRVPTRSPCGSCLLCPGDPLFVHALYVPQRPSSISHAP